MALHPSIKTPPTQTPPKALLANHTFPSTSLTPTPQSPSTSPPSSPQTPPTPKYSHLPIGSPPQLFPKFITLLPLAHPVTFAPCVFLYSSLPRLCPITTPFNPSASSPSPLIPPITPSSPVPLRSPSTLKTHHHLTSPPLPGGMVRVGGGEGRTRGDRVAFCLSLWSRPSLSLTLIQFSGCPPPPIPSPPFAST
jgi:hypothetical protein